MEKAEKAVHEEWPTLKHQEEHYVKSICYKGVHEVIKREAMTTWQQPQLSKCCASEWRLHAVLLNSDVQDQLLVPKVNWEYQVLWQCKSPQVANIKSYLMCLLISTLVPSFVIFFSFKLMDEPNAFNYIQGMPFRNAFQLSPHTILLPRDSLTSLRWKVISTTKTHSNRFNQLRCT